MAWAARLQLRQPKRNLSKQRGQIKLYGSSGWKSALKPQAEQLGAELNAELTKLGSERVGPMANTDQVATYFQISVITSASPSPES